MKKLIISCFLLFSFYIAKAQTIPNNDTLTWLKTNIEQRSSYFSNKPLQVIWDSLYDLKTKFYEYDVPINTRQFSDEIRTGLAANKDTLFKKAITVYFSEISDGGYVQQIHNQNNLNNFRNKTNNKVNTHVLFVKIYFKQPVPFLKVWCDTHLGSELWSSNMQMYFGKFIVDKVEVGEY